MPEYLVKVSVANSVVVFVPGTWLTLVLYKDLVATHTYNALEK